MITAALILGFFVAATYGVIRYRVESQKVDVFLASLRDDTEGQR